MSTAAQGELMLGDPRVVGNGNSARSALIKRLEAEVLPGMGLVFERTAPEAALAASVRAASGTNGDHWPTFNAWAEASPERKYALVPVARHPKHDGHPGREWRVAMDAHMQHVAWQEIQGHRVVYVFADLTAIPLDDLREGTNFTVTDKGANEHIAIGGELLPLTYVVAA